MADAVVSLVAVKVYVVGSGTIENIFIHPRCCGVAAIRRENACLACRVRSCGHGVRDHDYVASDSRISAKYRIESIQGSYRTPQYKNGGLRDALPVAGIV